MSHRVVADDLARQYLGGEHLAFATALDNFGLLYKTVGNHIDAEPLLSQTLEVRDNLAAVYAATARLPGERIAPLLRVPS